MIKYFWSACGYSLMSIPILFPAAKEAMKAVQGEMHHQVASRTESESARALLDSPHPQATSRTGDCSSPSPMPADV